MSSSDLSGFSKKELKLVCVYSGLCKKSDNLSKKEMRRLLKQNKKLVISKIHGGMPPSPFCNPFAAAAFQTPPTPTTVSEVSDLFKTYQENYSEYLSKGQEEKKFQNEYSAKSFASFLVLSERYKVKPPSDTQPPSPNQIKYLSNSTNASAYIYPLIIGGACFLKVQNQGRCSDSFDHIENDCIVSRLIRKLAESDDTFKRNHVTNFVPILTSYTLPSPEFKTSDYLLLPHFQTAYQKTMSIPFLIGSPLLRILKNKYSAENRTPGIYFDDTNQNYNIVVVSQPSQENDKKYPLKDLLFDLFQSMKYLYSEIGMIHNDAHLGNLFFDKKFGKLVLIDYGRASIDLNKLNNHQNVKRDIVDSEVQKLNYKNIDGHYPSYPRDFTNVYTIYPEESKSDVPLYMNDVASICFNIYRYLFEKFNYSNDTLFFKIHRESSSNPITSSTSSSGTASSVTSGSSTSANELELNFTIDLSTYANHLSTSLHIKNSTLETVLNQGLYWLANYVTNYNNSNNSQIKTLGDLCGGQIMAPLLENGVFNALSFKFEYVEGCIQKLISETKTPSPSTPQQGQKPTNRADSDYMITCTTKQSGGTDEDFEKLYNAEDTDLQEAINDYTEEKEEPKERKYTTAQMQTPINQQIPASTTNPPGAPVKAPNGFKKDIDSALLQAKFNARMCHLKTLFEKK